MESIRTSINKVLIKDQVKLLCDRFTTLLTASTFS